MGATDTQNNILNVINGINADEMRNLVMERITLPGRVWEERYRLVAGDEPKM